MTKKDFVASGKDQFAKGNITLDDLFQVQFVGGDLDGSVKTDSSSQNFTKVFQDRIAFERSTGRANVPKSMIGVYSHLLSVMNGPISITA